MLAAARLHAQEPSAEDQAVDAMRSLPQINAGDQQRIADWVQSKVTGLTSTPEKDRPAAALKFRETFRSQFENPANAPAFKTQFPVQTAAVAAGQFANTSLDSTTSAALARALLDMSHPETVPGLIAGLKSSHAQTRYLCAAGLARPAVKAAIAADKEKLATAVQAVKAAGVTEMNPVALSRIYLALSIPEQPAAVLDAYLAIFEQRLKSRRAGATADAAEIDAFEFLRNPVVARTLNADQKSQLAKLIAVFLRLDAERYVTPTLDFAEIDLLERRLDAGEDILASLVDSQAKGGKVREELAAGGHDRRAEVQNEVYKWIGHPETKEPGALNAAPLNVPLAAP